MRKTGRRWAGLVPALLPAIPVLDNMVLVARRTGPARRPEGGVSEPAGGGAGGPLRGEPGGPAPRVRPAVLRGGGARPGGPGPARRVACWTGLAPAAAR